jgi:4-carboxymuconolactone decarboxylase
VDWLASAIQLTGTLFFNISTYEAMKHVSTPGRPEAMPHRPAQRDSSQPDDARSHPQRMMAERRTGRGAFRDEGGTMAMSEQTDEILEQMADSNPELIEGLIGLHLQNIENSGLDPRTHALVRLASLITLGAPSASYAWQLSLARESGVTAEEIAGVLVAVAPTAGLPRAVAAAPEIKAALAA